MNEATMVMIDQATYVRTEAELTRLRAENAAMIQALDRLTREIDSLTTMVDAIMASADPS